MVKTSTILGLLLTWLVQAQAATRTDRYYVNFVPFEEGGDLIATGGAKRKFYTTYDEAAGADGLSTPMGDYFLLSANYAHPSIAADIINDNKMTLVMDDEMLSTLVFGGVFFPDIPLPAKWSVYGGSGAFKDVTATDVDTDGVVVFFDVTVKVDDATDDEPNDDEATDDEPNDDENSPDDDSGATYHQFRGVTGLVVAALSFFSLVVTF